MAEKAQLGSLLVVALAAVAVPLLFALLPRHFPIPILVGEMAAGIVLGRSGAGWIAVGPWLRFLDLFGLAFLLFLAGSEVDFRLMRLSLGRGLRGLLESPLGVGLVGIAVRLPLAFAAAGLLVVAGLLPGVTLAAPILAGSSLGVVLSVLKERGLQEGRYGQMLIVSAAVADFSTVLIVTLLFSSSSHSSTGARATLIALLVLLAFALLLGLRHVTRLTALGALIERPSGATAQIRIRGSFALLLGFTALADRLGLELILGSFLAGAIVAALAPERAHPLYTVKLDAVGYGFFVPIFFVVTGATLDLPALAANHKSLALVPLLLLAMAVVKAVPAGLYCLHSPPRACAAAGVLQTAQLMLPVAAVQIGEQLHIISNSVGAAVILASFLSMLLAPIGFSILAPANAPSAASPAETGAAASSPAQASSGVPPVAPPRSAR